MRKTFTAAIAFWLTRPSMIASAAATSAEHEVLQSDRESQPEQFPVEQLIAE